MKNKLITGGILFFIILGSFTLLKSETSKYTRLFNGKDFSGWNLKIRSGDASEASRVFSVNEKGWVHVFRNHPDNYNLNQGNNQTHGLMYTEKSYSKYSFRFEYKWGKKIMNNFDQFQYDAGMYYHVYNDKIWPNGLEYQVRYDHTQDQNHTGDFWSSGVAIQWFSQDSTTFQAPWNGGEPQPKRGGEHLAINNPDYHALDNKWNKCEVIVMGNKYTIHKLNGQIVNYATDLSHSEGIIGLQSETAEIFYRNIEIKEFDEFLPMKEFL